MYTSYNPAGVLIRNASARIQDTAQLSMVKPLSE